jgi:hypothetical protein
LGYKTTRARLNKEWILLAENFHLVWWKGLHETRKDFTKRCWTWLTKQVLEFSRTNMQLVYWKIDVDTQCPDCGEVEEHIMYMV